jgi:general secretion pathway protein K
MMRCRRQQGVVLLVVLFFALLLTASIATFIRRSTIDALVARNRDQAAQAEALARGGIRLGRSILILDRELKLASENPIDSHLDEWFQIDSSGIPAGEGAALQLRIEDSGSRFNLNSAFDHAKGGDPFPETDPFLQQLFEKVIDEMDIPPGEKFYDVSDLAEALIDWIDANDVRLKGGIEDDYYQQQTPPYRAANRPLLSIDELFLIEGFDRKLVAQLRPYITVTPFVGGGGVNLNTAPPHILALLYFNDGVDERLAHEDEVKQILDIREDGGLLCGESLSLDGCTPITSIVPNQIFPEPTYSASVFTIVADASVGEIHRSVEAVINRAADPPLVLSWKVR